MPNGEPALLKRRQCLRRQGWRNTDPVWGPGPVVNHKNERALNPSQRVLLSLHHFGFSVSGGMTKS